MLVGELDYEDMLERNDLKNITGKMVRNDNNEFILTNVTIEEVFEQTYFPITTHLVMTMFMFFMAIIVMNLLFGLAVTDVQVGIVYS